MKRETINRLLLVGLLGTVAYANEEDHHDHVGDTKIKVQYETLDFENSLKKEDGKRYGVGIDHQNEKHHYQFYYEKTNTNTTNLVPKDLEVKKYTAKYQYAPNKANRVSLSYATIDDNIMKEVDGGHIYGLAYKYKAVSLTQYLSDYSHFDVYQTDLKVGMKRVFNNIEVMGAIEGKYINLKDRESNAFSKNAKREYFTTGLKLHAHYDDWHFGMGTYIGERIFAVMNEGFRVQHHAMEFKNTYMAGIGKEFGDTLVHLRYINQEAKEVPMNHDNVKVDNWALEVEYKF